MIVADPLEIQHVKNKENGEFFVEVDQDKKGFLSYLLFGSGRMIILHTEVTRDMKGTGLAYRLLDAAIAEARSKGFRILPKCPFAKMVMYKNREKYKDVLV